MRKPIRTVLLLIFFTLILTACGAPAPEHTVQPGSTNIVNIGDMWYIPVNLEGLPERNVEEIFFAIQYWQEAHPELQIVDVDYLYMQNTYSSQTNNYTYGISLLTAPK